MFSRALQTSDHLFSVFKSIFGSSTEAHDVLKEENFYMFVCLSVLPCEALKDHFDLLSSFPKPFGPYEALLLDILLISEAL